MKGQLNEAIRIFEEVHRLTNHPLKGLSPLAYRYARTGQIEKAHECLAKIEQRHREEPGSLIEMDLAFIWWAPGDKDKTFHYLFEALSK